MHLIEILLPLADAVGSPFPEEMFENLAQTVCRANAAMAFSALA